MASDGSMEANGMRRSVLQWYVDALPTSASSITYDT